MCAWYMVCGVWGVGCGEPKRKPSDDLLLVPSNRRLSLQLARTILCCGLVRLATSKPRHPSVPTPLPALGLWKHTAVPGLGWWRLELRSSHRPCHLLDLILIFQTPCALEELFFYYIYVLVCFMHVQRSGDKRWGQFSPFTM